MPLFYDKEVKVFKTSCGPFDNNSYLIVCPQTGESIIIDAPTEPGKVLEEASGTQVKGILITHNHQDHLLGFDAITGAVDAPVGIGTKDAHALPDAPALSLTDGSVVRFGNRAMQVLDTPGHTDGAACFLIGKHLFSGDTLFPGGPGKTRSPQAFKQVVDSITKKLLVLPDDTAVYPGHGDDTSIGKAREEYQTFASKAHPEDIHGEIAWLTS